MTNNLNMWILEKTAPLTIWCSLDSDLCMVDFYFSFAGEIRHDRLVKITQDDLIVAMADKYDTPEKRAWIKDELESEMVVESNEIEKLTGISRDFAKELDNLCKIRK